MLLEMTQGASHRSMDGVDASPQWQSYLLEQASGHPLFRRYRLGIQGGTGFVVLTGKVNSFYEKQVAQEFFRHCDGVQQIDNRIEVAYAE
jgi:osmotically-inducible protein OsmY